MWEAELGVRHYGCPVSDTSQNYPDVSIENVSKICLAGEKAKRLLRVRGDPDAARDFAAEFRTHDVTVSLDLVSDHDGGPMYFTSELAYRGDSSSILRQIQHTECYEHSTVLVNQGIEHWTVYAEYKDQIRSLVTRLEELNNNVDLRRSIDVGPITDGRSVQLATLRTQLTDKQIAAYEAALELGYYDPDESPTIEDIATHLGLHRSTVGEHVQKVENAILTEIGKQIVH
ncbi:MAG: helix-turn-helix domain-containing protein [Halolamina sp.]